jgi:DinB family protein
MPIVPDTKSWMWVLERRCDECGFEAATFPRADVSRLIQENAAAWQAVLARPNASQRPSDSVWSPLEYACHVRDVYRIYDTRLALMLTEDNPLYPNWDQDTAAIEDRYDLQDPVTVARELDAAARAIAERFATVDGELWERPGTRNDGVHYTIESFARYMIHDPIHHLHDVTAR